jgi:hypothetical protein
MLIHRPAQRDSALWLVFVLLVGACAVWLAFGAARALGAGPRCGDTITQDTRLTSDLTNCPGDGLVMGADDIRLDLNGHEIAGAPHAGLLCFSGGPPPGPCFGVRTNGHSGLTITHGTVTNFDTDVGTPVPESSSRDRITRLTTTNSTSGDIRVGDDSVVAFNAITGILSVESGSTVAFNVGAGDSKLVAFNGNHDSIERNVVATILLEFASNSRVANNLVRDGVVSVASRSDFNTVASNRLLRSHIAVVGSAHNVLFRNVIIGTPFSSDGIFLGFDPERGISSDTNVLLGNRISGAGNDGIHIEAAHALVRLNVTSRNGHDGIETGDPTTTMTRNIANRNANLGIESVQGAIDGGGNRAHGNGNSLQCINIVCSP